MKQKLKELYKESQLPWSVFLVELLNALAWLNRVYTDTTVSYYIPGDKAEEDKHGGQGNPG